MLCYASFQVLTTHTASKLSRKNNNNDEQTRLLPSCSAFQPHLGASVRPGKEPFVQHAVLVPREGASESEHQSEHVLRVDHGVKVVDLLLKHLPRFCGCCCG